MGHRGRLEGRDGGGPFREITPFGFDPVDGTIGTSTRRGRGSISHGTPETDTLRTINANNPTSTASPTAAGEVVATDSDPLGPVIEKRSANRSFFATGASSGNGTGARRASLRGISCANAKVSGMRTIRRPPASSTITAETAPPRPGAPRAATRPSQDDRIPLASRKMTTHPANTNAAKRANAALDFAIAAGDGAEPDMRPHRKITVTIAETRAAGLGRIESPDEVSE
jgi:hypothetical protein